MNAQNSASKLLKRWDNAVPMSCNSESVSRFASWHTIGCNRDAAWMVMRGDTAERFLCDCCRQNEGLVA